jgi:hypothetical protein
MPVSLSDDQKSRIRHHLGYLEVQEASTFVLGVPAGVQTQFMIEGAFDKILPSALARVESALGRLDAVEQQIEDNTENVAVDELGDITLRKDEFNQLIIRYQYWQGTLANIFGVAPNPFDQRFTRWGGGGGGINVSVQH